MSRFVDNQIEEAYNHIKQYLNNPEHNTTDDLRTMCQNCECYCGNEHDYEECKEKNCFRFWLAYVYLEWYLSS